MTRLHLLALPFLASLLLVSAQSCPQDTQDSIQSCLDAVEVAESKLPQPCASEDKSCYCERQKLLLSCYDPCPELTPYNAIRFNNEQCQNTPIDDWGVTLTTIGAGSGGAAPTADSSSSSSSTTSAAATATAAPMSSSSSSISTTSSSMSAAQTSSASTAGSNGASGLSFSPASQAITALLIGATLFGAVAL